MKWYYLVFLVIIGSIGIFLEVWIFRNSEKENAIERMGTTAGVFVALGSGIIALSNADRKPKKIKAEVRIQASPTKEIETHFLKDLPEPIQKSYKTSPESVTSYQIYFKIINKSGFTLIRPTLTFKLPNANRHPEQIEVINSDVEPPETVKIWRLSNRSNLFYNRPDVKILQYLDFSVLSESSLPYLNPKEEPLDFWIRMCLDKESTEKVRVSLSFNSANAEGRYFDFELVPKDLLSGTEYVKS